MTKAKQPINTTKSKLSTVLPIIFGLMFVVSVGMNGAVEYYHRNVDIAGDVQYARLFLGFALFSAISIVVGCIVFYMSNSWVTRTVMVAAGVIMAIVTYNMAITAVFTNF